jgi:hypothetical protein
LLWVVGSVRTASVLVTAMIAVGALVEDDIARPLRFSFVVAPGVAALAAVEPPAAPHRKAARSGDLSSVHRLIHRIASPAVDSRPAGAVDAEARVRRAVCEAGRRARTRVGTRRLITFRP